MVSGRVIQFNENRGYGFIAPDGGGEDVFLHLAEVKTDAKLLRVGTAVNFGVMEGQRGLKAYDVSVVAEPHATVKTAPAATTMTAASEGDLIDVISASEYAREITDAIISACPDVTAAMIVDVRERLIAQARKRDWLDD